MNVDERKVSAREARSAIRTVAKRLALLHMCYARTLVGELGETEGKELIKKAIWDYGALVGEHARARVETLGLETSPENFKKGSDLSSLGFVHKEVVVDGEKRSQSFGYALAEVWQEHDELDLGGLYCLVDPAKMQAYNDDWSMVHTKRTLAGDECCEHAIRPLDESK